MRSITNLTDFLKSLAPEQKGSEPPRDPSLRVLAALRDVKMMPLADLPKAASLSSQECLDVVERLRAAEQVEVVELEEDSPHRFLRLTPGGYAYLAEIRDKRA